MVAKCSNEVLNLMTRLRDKESENSELKTRIQEIEAKLLATEAKLEESRASASQKVIYALFIIVFRYLLFLLT